MAVRCPLIARPLLEIQVRNQAGPATVVTLDAGRQTLRHLCRPLVLREITLIDHPHNRHGSQRPQSKLMARLDNSKNFKINEMNGFQLIKQNSLTR
jgi:hypothetical protein